jgi:hypothetical protein
LRLTPSGVKASSGLRLNEHLAHDGESVFRHACKMGLEGIVSKRLGSRYRSGPRRSGSRANLSWAYLTEADLSRANLSGANLQAAILIDTDFSRADLAGCRVYGASAWGLKLGGTKQQNLVITHADKPAITVDNIVCA